MDKPFSDRPSGLTRQIKTTAQQGVDFAKSEYRWVGTLFLGLLIMAASILLAVYFSNKSEKDKGELISQQDAARATAVGVVLEAIAAAQDSDRVVHQRTDSVFTYILRRLEKFHGDGFKNLKMPAPAYIDTAGLRRQILKQEKK